MTVDTSSSNNHGVTFLVSIDKENELYAIKKGFNSEIIYQGPFSTLKEINLFIRFAWYIAYAIAYIAIALTLEQAADVFNFSYPIFTKYILSYGTVNLAFAFFTYNIKLISIQMTNIPYAIQIAEDADDAMVKAGDQLRQQNNRHGINTTMDE